jgi:hypothetical protein
VTFEEKPAGALVPGDQIVQRDGSRLAPARMLRVSSVERAGDHVLVVFREGSGPVRLAVGAPVVVLPKVERVGWWVQE